MGNGEWNVRPEFKVATTTPPRTALRKRIAVILLMSVLTSSGCGKNPTPAAANVSHDDSEVEVKPGILSFRLDGQQIDPAVAKRLHELWQAIFELPPGAERDKLINELDAKPLPPGYFYDYWLRIHKVSPYDDSWTDEGFDPSKSSYPRDVQILAAVLYGIGDIENGGLHQFFGNPAGGFAPEMAEWFERADMPSAAKVFREAMAFFGKEYPRSQEARRTFRDAHPKNGRGESREDLDPFYELDRRLDAAAPKSVFDLRADAWLRNVCGVRHLRDNPTR